MHWARRSLILAALMIGVVGCTDRRTAVNPEKAPAKKEEAHEHGHSHERDKFLIADAGKYHALLTAHLAPGGNELDIFFETQDDKNPTPVAIPHETLTAYARRAGDEKEYELKFECAPADERPKGEKAGSCSHFVAEADWLKADDTLTVTLNLRLGEERHRVEWRDFVPKTYAHHEEK